jgi:hypothetical protein
MLATVRGNRSVVKILSKMPSSYPKVACGFGLYHLAALSGSVEVMQLIHNGLLQQHQHQHQHEYQPQKSELYGMLLWTKEQDHHGIPSIFHCAAYQGNPEMVEWLFRHEVNANVINEDHWTPLHFAAYRGHSECVRVLCSHKVAVNPLTSCRWTPLSLAAMFDSKASHQTIEILLKFGATEGAIPASLISVSTGNMKALEALSSGSSCLTSRRHVEGIGHLSPLEVSHFFENVPDIEHLRQKLHSNTSSDTCHPQHTNNNNNDNNNNSHKENTHNHGEAQK